MIGGPAFAQDSSHGELSAGLRYYHATINSVVTPIQLPLPNDYPKGWYADVAINVSPKFAIVGEAGGTYHADEDGTTTGPVSTQESFDVKFHTFMGGVRVRAPQHAALVPFGQVLFGGEHDSSVDDRTTTFFQNVVSSRREGVSSNAVLALDAGVTAAVGWIGARASVGYVRLFSDADSDAFRFSLGGVFRF
jgi:hypothetical protein